jgi:DNA primase
MRYPPHLLDEIRARLPVSRVVERHVKLKRTGREYTGLSPFKNERTPSFTVNDQKGFYHCFASGEHGDVFKFIMATEGLSFPEAVERLAAEAGVSLPPPVPVDEVKASHEERLFSAMEEACQLFPVALNPGGTRPGYLDRRGLRPPTSKPSAWYAGQQTALKSHLSQRLHARRMQEADF